MLKMKMLGSPHLMLSDLCRDDRIAFMRGFPQFADSLLRHAFSLVFRNGKTIGCAPALDPRPPFFIIRCAELAAFQDSEHLFHDPADIADNRQVNTDGLVDR